jgi:hypothetical protein
MADLQVLASEAFGVQSSAGETCEVENVLEHTGKDSILKRKYWILTLWIIM